MKFGSLGRERDIELLRQRCTDAIMRDKWIAQTSAAHDMNDGIGSVEAFLVTTRNAVFPVSQAARDPALTLLARIAIYYPECLVIWRELAQSEKWADRFSVACRLYSVIPETLSDQLFSALRHDKSAKIRKYAFDRYENRAGPDRYIVFKMFDAECPSSPGFKVGD
jgi:hypothetical protein